MSEVRPENVDITPPFDALADRTTFELVDRRWAPFVSELATLPKSNPKLARLLACKPAWKA